MRFRTPQKTQNSFIDIAPFVDTVFNLLIFFALSLNFISTPGIRVNLPKSTAQEIVRKEKDLRIVVTSANELFLNEQAVQRNDLAKHLADAAQSNNQTQILIQADEQVSHGTVVWVMDQARQAGLNRLAIITQPTAEPDSAKR
ncbi:MAG: biopolymer transporter ExbD [Deltaproteobacteria bacterium]|nr:biopolymer transporter ExbD [Deltaproteobacteria bacterium]